MIWRICGSLRLCQNLCQKLKIFMTAVLGEISDFVHFLNIVFSDMWVTSRSQNCILKCSFVDLKDLWKFEFQSKFCQKLKIFMTVVVSEISDFDHFFTLSFLTCEWIVGLKLYSKEFSCWFEGFVEVWVWVKILSKIENFHERGP